MFGRSVSIIMFTIIAAGTSIARAGDWPQSQELVADDGAADWEFGRSVAISGDTMICGASRADGGQSSTGAAYIFVRDGDGTWTQQAKLFGSDVESFDEFGLSVDIDGDTAIVGAPFADATSYDSGAAYIFTRDGNGNWSEQAKLVDGNVVSFGWMGWSVAIDGDTAVAGSPQDGNFSYFGGSASVFARDGNDQWSLQQHVVANDESDFDMFGTDVDLDGDSLVIGAPQASSIAFYGGAAYVFTRSGTTWSQQDKLQATGPEDGDLLGQSVAISGDVTVLGVPGGRVNGTQTGSVATFERIGTNWFEGPMLSASDASFNDRFGISVAFDGTHAAIGAYWDGDNGSNSGSAYVFERLGQGSWAQVDKLLASDGAAGDWLGESVAIDSGLAIVGSANHDDLGDGSGAAYVYGSRSDGLTLEIVGPCPGTVDVNITGATPDARVAIAVGFDPGEFTVPAGPCPGLTLDIIPPFSRGTPFILDTDANGNASLSTPLPPNACDELLVQAVDITTCEKSNVVAK